MEEKLLYDDRSDIKIISNDNCISKEWKLLPNTFRMESVMPSDVIYNNGKKWVIFYMHHSYSIEKCYIDKKTWKKRVSVVNPWHTWIKLDIAFDDAKKIFDWRVSYIDFDKLFQ